MNDKTSNNSGFQGQQILEHAPDGIFRPKPLPGVPTTLQTFMDLSKKGKITSAPAATVVKRTQKVNEAFILTADG